MPLTYGFEAFVVVLGVTLGLTLLTLIPAIILAIVHRKDFFDDAQKITCMIKTRRALTVLATIPFSFFFVSLATFNYYPWYAAAIIITIIGSVEAYFTRYWIILPSCKGKGTTKLLALWIPLAIVFLIIIWFFSFFLSGICIGFHPDVVTFAGTRIGQPDLCPDYAPAPCHVYLTMGLNVSSQMNVIFQASVKYSQPMVWYSLNGNITTNFSVNAESNYFDLISYFTTRYVYYGFLSNLSPNTTYYFIVGDAANRKSLSPLKKFRSGPAPGSPFTFAIGGDVGCEDPYPTITTIEVAKHDPHFLVLGGDLAYANGLPGCYQRWDYILWMFQNNLVSSTGYTIPLIIAIGNHEAGVPWGSYNKKTAPYYFAYLPHEPLDGRLPGDLPTYRYHTISDNTVLFALDSEITLTAESQVDWLSNQMEVVHASIPNKLAVYHIPMYPGSRAPTDLPIPSIRTAWTPIFDKYNLKVAFENHDHVFVRTCILKNNEIDLNGTLYVGDGAYGVVGDLAADIMSRNYIVKAQAIRHFMLVDVQGTNITITTIANDGTILDVVSQT